MEPVLKVEATVIGKSSSPHEGQPVVVTLDVPALKQQIQLVVGGDSGIDPKAFEETVVQQTDPQTNQQFNIYANADQRQKFYLCLFSKAEVDQAEAEYKAHLEKVAEQEKAMTAQQKGAGALGASGMGQAAKPAPSPVTPAAPPPTPPAPPAPVPGDTAETK